MKTLPMFKLDVKKFREQKVKSDIPASAQDNLIAGI